jgi:O-succinylbenzoate synthase
MIGDEGTNSYYKKWEEISKEIDPKDISVTFGKPLTEEEFKKFREEQARQGLAAPVIMQAGGKDPKDRLKEKLQTMAKERGAKK